MAGPGELLEVDRKPVLESRAHGWRSSQLESCQPAPWRPTTQGVVNIQPSTTDNPPAPCGSLRQAGGQVRTPACAAGRTCSHEDFLSRCNGKWSCRPGRLWVRRHQHAPPTTAERTTELEPWRRPTAQLTAVRRTSNSGTCGGGAGSAEQIFFAARDGGGGGACSPVMGSAALSW